MTKRIALWAILASMAAASSGVAAVHFWNQTELETPPTFDPLNDCPSHFDGFQHRVVWHSGGKRLLIQANRACGDKLGHTYELENVSISIVSGTTEIARLESPSAVYSLAQNKIVVGDSVESSALHCLGNTPLIAIDLASSEVRIPGRRFLLNNDDPLPCEKR